MKPTPVVLRVAGHILHGPSMLRTDQSAKRCEKYKYRRLPVISARPETYLLNQGSFHLWFDGLVPVVNEKDPWKDSYWRIIPCAEPASLWVGNLYLREIPWGYSHSSSFEMPQGILRLPTTV